MSLFFLFNLISSVSFFIYGAGCLISDYMRLEFERYGFPAYRIIVGVLELAGATGLLIGILYPVIGALAAGGLSLLMLMGFIVRIKIRDGWLKSSPALAYLLLNSYLLSQFLFPFTG